VATSPHDFKLLVAGDGRTSTSMADVGEAAARSADRDEPPAPMGAAPPPPPPPAVSAAPPGHNGHSAPPPGFLG
jgi:hypothetical protein